MALSSLANTTWKFNSTVTVLSSSVQYSVTGYCGDSGYSYADGFIGFNIGYNDRTQTSENYVSVDRDETSTENIVEGGTPLFDAIKFVSGDDIANSTLIAWVEANAVQTTVFDVSTLSVGGGVRVITTKAKATGYITSAASNSVSYSYPYSITPTLTHVTGKSDNATQLYPGKTATLYYYSDEGYNLPSTVSVTGATSTWSVVDAYTITATATNMTIEGETSYTGIIASGSALRINLTADGTNYKVPTSAPTVTGATSLYTRVSDTAAYITLSNPTGNVSFTVVAEAVASGYSVNVTLTGNLTSSFYWDMYYIYDGNSVSGTYLGHMTAVTTTFSITSGHIYVYYCGAPEEQIVGATGTTGISVTGYDCEYAAADVSANGTLTVDTYLD